MIRFNYKKEKDEKVSVLIVSEKNDTHTLVGRLLFDEEDWNNFWRAFLIINELDMVGSGKIDFKFENNIVKED